MSQTLFFIRSPIRIIPTSETRISKLVKRESYSISNLFFAQKNTSLLINNTAVYLFPFPAIFAHESRKVTVLLKTRPLSEESTESTQK